MLGTSLFNLNVELDEWARLCPLFKTWNMKRFLFILIVCEQMALACVAANRTIKGHVVDESGRNVEFASIHVDSVYAVSDKGAAPQKVDTERWKTDGK